ncbi:hypothetical protein Fcan01_02801 [Folsomia candida]|uniref:Large ribosomal subunit protein uL24m n=1 Tax=Folsomia candida TaxID=158441 RepID=A0A226EZ47_FOLCA|nr:hypothetical protein Fcan01_02801 [Folsomia candida]
MKVEFQTPNRREYQNKKLEQGVYRFTANRPWTDEWKRQNDKARRPVVVEPIRDWNFFRGDRVEVLVGRDRGKHGIVSQVIQERNWIFVAGLNTHLRRVGSRQEGSAGFYVKSEAPLLVTNQVALVDPSDNKTTKVEWRFTEDGERVRVSLRTGRIIPLPPSGFETWDYKTPETYLEGDKDTKADVVKAVNFRPTLKTFEMEIMESMGIIEHRVPKKSYWY